MSGGGSGGSLECRLIVSLASYGIRPKKRLNLDLKKSASYKWALKHILQCNICLIFPFVPRRCPDRANAGGALVFLGKFYTFHSIHTVTTVNTFTTVTTLTTCT